MMRESDFCAFILTHGRPDKVVTYNSLRKSGYTGRIFLVVDDEDKTAEQYRARFGEEVLTFSKADVASRSDEGYNPKARKVILYARNAAFELAERLGIKYFIELDDDYTMFRYEFDRRGEIGVKRILDLDTVFDLLLDFYKAIPALSIAIAQGGDFMGGRNETIKTKRKAMNSFICSTDRPFRFFGYLNEDVNAYTDLARKGGLFLTILQIALLQMATQKNAGGMSEAYLASGTYMKSFFSVVYCPSAVRISMLGRDHRRIHHAINWNAVAPRILREEHRKAG
jgi:hypothetical protein